MNRMNVNFDYKRQDLINIMIEKISKAKDFSEVVEYALQNVTSIINCRIGQCMIIKKELLKTVNLKRLVIQIDRVDGNFFSVISNTDKDLSKPAFMNITEARKAMISDRYLSVPIFSDENELVATFQVEALYSN